MLEHDILPWKLLDHYSFLVWPFDIALYSEVRRNLINLGIKLLTSGIMNKLDGLIEVLRLRDIR